MPRNPVLFSQARSYGSIRVLKPRCGAMGRGGPARLSEDMRSNPAALLPGRGMATARCCSASTVRFRHMALVRSYVGVTPFAEAAQKVMLRICLASAQCHDRSWMNWSQPADSGAIGDKPLLLFSLEEAFAGFFNAAHLVQSNLQDLLWFLGRKVITVSNQPFINISGLERRFALFENPKNGWSQASSCCLASVNGRRNRRCLSYSIIAVGYFRD